MSVAPIPCKNLTETEYSKQKNSPISLKKKIEIEIEIFRVDSSWYIYQDTLSLNRGNIICKNIDSTAYYTEIRTSDNLWSYLHG